MTNAEKTTYIRVDPRSDLLNSLQHSHLCLHLSQTDDQNWKWCVAAAHSAAQAAMTTVLDRQGNYEHLDLKSRKQLIKYLNQTPDELSKRYPDIRLASFLEMYDSCAPHMQQSEITPERRKRLQRLNFLRNNWTHFKVSGWSISVDYARRAVLAGIELVTELPLNPDSLYDDISDASLHKSMTASVLVLLKGNEQANYL